MTMDCPRCGFNQPKDRFCASCGLDVETFVPRRPSLLKRVAGRPGTYVALAAVLMALALMFVLSVYAPAIRQVRGQFVSSRDAADPDDDPAPESVAVPAPAPPPPEPTAAPAEEPPVPAVVDGGTGAPAVTATAPKPVATATMLEAEFWEVERAPSLRVLSGGDRVAEDHDGRAILMRDPEKVREWLRTSARPLGAPFHGPLTEGAQIVIETPPGTPEAFRFGMMLQLSKWEAGRATLRFASAQALDGTAELVAGERLVIVIEPRTRRHAPEVVDKAGPGPWVVFRSPNFRAGETAWIFTVRLR